MVAYNHFYTDNICIYIFKRKNKQEFNYLLSVFHSQMKKHLSQDFMQYTP